MCKNNYVKSFFVTQICFVVFVEVALKCCRVDNLYRPHCNSTDAGGGGIKGSYWQKILKAES